MGQLAISFNELIDNAANLATTLFTLCLMFCGVLAGPNVIPGFWIFMYRCNPFTYLIQAILSTGLANAKVTCAPRELVTLKPPMGETCSSFIGPYTEAAGGYFSTNSDGTCSVCRIDSTNQFLESINALFSQRWRNFGIFVAFIGINIILTIFFYWLARVPKGNREKKLNK